MPDTPVVFMQHAAAAGRRDTMAVPTQTNERTENTNDHSHSEDENTDRTNVCISFGRAPFFMLYDSETKNASFIDNNAASSQGGAGIRAAQNIVDSKADALLTPRWRGQCGRGFESRRRRAV
jgi:hypothetical protein